MGKKKRRGRLRMNRKMMTWICIFERASYWVWSGWYGGYLAFGFGVDAGVR